MRAKSINIMYIVTLYFLVSLFLFISGSTGRILIENLDMTREMAIFIQGIIFTGLTLVTLFILKTKNPDVLKDIDLIGVKSKKRLVVGITIPVILVLLGISTAYAFGAIENISINFTISVITAVLINTVTAFLYEAFPEEVFLRGLIVQELGKKFRLSIILLIQPVIFILVPTLVIGLQALVFGDPFIITIDYIILIITFGAALQLYREYTGSLWMSIIFHLIYLEVARYISSGGMYADGVSLIEFDEVFGGFMMLYLSFLFVIILSLVVMGIMVYRDYTKLNSK